MDEMREKLEKFVEWMDGFLLGDGHICLTRTGQSAYARIGSKYLEWAEFAMSGFADYGLHAAYQAKCHSEKYGKTYESFHITVKSSGDFMEQRERWYPNGKKWIPADLRATPTSLLLWYLGDGSYADEVVNIAAYDFTEEENVFAARRFEESLGIKFTLHQSKGFKSKFYLPIDQHDKFFDTIGWMDPTGCYGYKFPSDRLRHKPTMSKSLASFCAELGIPDSWANTQVELGRVEVERVGRFVYPTDKGKEQLRELVKVEYRPRDGSTLSTLTQDDVIFSLHTSHGMVKRLIEKAGINPHRTPKGQYRFTQEEVDKMKEFLPNRKEKP